MTFNIHNEDTLIVWPESFSVLTDTRTDSPRYGKADIHVPLTVEGRVKLMDLLADRFPAEYAERRPALLLVTEDGIEVYGSLKAFSLHYPPAANTVWCEDDSDCINPTFIPDEPSWDTLWAEISDVRHSHADMFVEYPHTSEYFGIA